MNVQTGTRSTQRLGVSVSVSVSVAMPVPVPVHLRVYWGVTLANPIK